MPHTYWTIEHTNSVQQKTKPNILTTSNCSKKRPLKLCKCVQLWYGVKRPTNQAEDINLLRMSVLICAHLTHCSLSQLMPIKRIACSIWLRLILNWVPSCWYLHSCRIIAYRVVALPTKYFYFRYRLFRCHSHHQVNTMTLRTHHHHCYSQTEYYY